MTAIVLQIIGAFIPLVLAFLLAKRGSAAKRARDKAKSLERRERIENDVENDPDLLRRAKRSILRRK
jgi:hypothetical protein